MGIFLQVILIERSQPGNELYTSLAHNHSIVTHHYRRFEQLVTFANIPFLHNLLCLSLPGSPARAFLLFETTHKKGRASGGRRGLSFLL